MSASIASAVGIGGLVLSVGYEWYFLSLAYALLVTAAVAIHAASLGPQILARAVWWSNLALGAVLSVLGNEHESNGGVTLALACGGALLVVGRHGLGAASAAAGYAPAALRGMLLLLMVLALADAQTFLLFGTIGLFDHAASKVDAPWIMFSFGLAYVAGFVGLYRLQIWGALVSIAASLVALALLSLTSVLDHLDALKPFLGLLAIVHVVVATPVAIAVLRGKELVSPSRRVRTLVTSAVTGGLMLLSLCSWAAHR